MAHIVGISKCCVMTLILCIFFNDVVAQESSQLQNLHVKRTPQNYQYQLKDANNQTKIRVFLRRMRKAGSSTTAGFIQAALRTYAQITNINVDTEIIYDRMEYSALNIECLFGKNPILSPTNRVILITHFREPISRINSEYWFKGPGEILDQANETIWRNWIADTPNRLTSLGVGWNAGIYFDNYYTRLLSSSCGDCNLGTGGKIHLKDGGGAVKGCGSTNKLNPYQPISFNLSTPNSSLPSSFIEEHSSSLQNKYEQALVTLEQFQIVLIMEYFEKPSMNLWFRRAMEKELNVKQGSFHKLFLGHLRNNMKDVIKPKTNRTSTSTVDIQHDEDVDVGLLEHPQYRSRPPPSIVRTLMRDNLHDVSLYAIAKAKVDSLIAPFEYN